MSPARGRRRPRWRPEPDLGDLEAAYRRHHLREDARTAAWTLAVFAIFTGLFGLLDPRYLAGEELARMIGARIGLMLVLLVVALRLPRISDLTRFDRILFLTGLAGVITAFGANLARPGDYTHFATTDVVLIFGAYTLLPIPLAARGSLAALVTLGDVALFAGLKSPVPPMAATGSLFGLAAGNALGYLVSSRVHAYRRQQYLSRLELERRASRDDLTGALNRRAFVERAAEELARARLLARPLALLLIDLDHFKAVNDRHGHLVGDEALRALGRQLDELRREGDVFARLGGEEFALLLPDTAITGAVAAGERIRLAAAMSHAREDGSPVPLSVSVGVAEADEGEEEIEPLLARADRALYAAKAAGRDRVVADPPAVARSSGHAPAGNLSPALAQDEPGGGSAAGG